jgi:hypothetical protein
MISHIDKTLEELLRAEIPLPEADYDISFDIPTKEWTGRLSGTKSTLNIYLYDVSENRELRENEWRIEHNYDGTVTKKRPPVRIDLFYMLTAWSPAQSEAVLDEHHLLSKVLSVLFKYPDIPRDHYQGDLAKIELEYPILLAIDYPKIFKEQGAGQLWTAIDQYWKPFVPLIVTIPLDLQDHIRGRMVISKIIQYERPISESTIQIAGIVTNDKPDRNPVIGANVELRDSGDNAIDSMTTEKDGRFTFKNLSTGKYVLKISLKGFKDKRVTIDEVLSSKADDLIVKLKR